MSNEMQIREKAKKIVPLIVILIVIGVGVNALINIGNNVGYSPEQPIPYSHKIHAGQYHIPCMYCHSGVEKSTFANVPSLNVCMNCHRVVKTDSPYIKKMWEQYNDKKEPFHWIRVHNLPDFVYFNHKRHIAKGVQCQTCHGDIQNMARVKQVSALNMGWCLNCHRGVTTPAYLYTKDHPKGPVAPTSCYTCHR